MLNKTKTGKKTGWVGGGGITEKYIGSPHMKPEK